MAVEKQILSELGFGASLLRETPHRRCRTRVSGVVRHLLQFVRALSMPVDLVQTAW